MSVVEADEGVEWLFDGRLVNVNFMPGEQLVQSSSKEDRAIVVFPGSPDSMVETQCSGAEAYSPALRVIAASEPYPGICTAETGFIDRVDPGAGSPMENQIWIVQGKQGRYEPSPRPAIEIDGAQMSPV